MDGYGCVLGQNEIKVRAGGFAVGGGDSGFSTVKGSVAYWKRELGFRRTREQVQAPPCFSCGTLLLPSFFGALSNRWQKVLQISLIVGSFSSKCL